MYQEILKEVQEKQKGQGNTRNQKIVLEQSWLEDKKAEGAMCTKCKARLADSIDHIIPKHILGDFGLDPERFFDPDNYEALCRLCNRIKGSRLDFTNPKTKPLLLKYLETV